MENSNTYQDTKPLEFRQIVLTHIRNILDLSLRVNSDGENLNLYIDSIETLADVLIPFYDKDMNSEYEQFENALTDLRKSNYEKQKSLNPSQYSRGYAQVNYAKKKQLYRNLFRKLNLLLKRNDYLQQSVYGEDSSEEIIDEEGGESENE